MPTSSFGPCKVPTSPLEPIFEKVRSGGRVSFEEGVLLFKSEDLPGLGSIANHIKEKKSGDRVTFVVNRQINPTNVCVNACRFCDFSVRKNDEKAYVLSVQDILSLCSGDLKEVHITGALHPDWSFERYLGIVRAINEKFPSLQIKAYAAVEVDHFSRIERCSEKAVLERLKEAGLVCLAGGGAEIFSERVRRLLFPDKIGSERWLQIHRTAHGLGIRSNATMLYGHIETVEERVSHLLKLRELQDETGGFLSFIPLAYQPGRSQVVPKRTSAVDDLKTVAVARILLDNFPHIKSYWVSVGESVSAVSLVFGADDLDGTVGREKIMHAAGVQTPEGMTRLKLQNIIRSAGRVPAERDALYNLI